MAQLGLFESSATKPNQVWDADDISLHGEYVQIYKREGGDGLMEQVAIVRLAPGQHVSRLDTLRKAATTGPPRFTPEPDKTVIAVPRTPPTSKSSS
jgi:hypothetical protein